MPRSARIQKNRPLSFSAFCQAVKSKVHQTDGPCRQQSDQRPAQEGQREFAEWKSGGKLRNRGTCVPSRFGSGCFHKSRRKAQIRTRPRWGLGSDLSCLVRMAGLEPARPWDTSTSSWPVYQFQHIRMAPRLGHLNIIAGRKAFVKIFYFPRGKIMGIARGERDKLSKLSRKIECFANFPCLFGRTAL